MRVCQPGPLAFQRASTSGGKRKEMGLLGASLFGRPRGRNSLLAIALPKISGSTSRAGRARRKSSAVHAGLSGSVRTRFVFRLVFIEAYFSLIRLPKTDDVRLPSDVARIFRRVERKVHPFTVYTINRGEGAREYADPDLDGRYLRVVTLEDKVTVHNAFPDRRFRP